MVVLLVSEEGMGERLRLRLRLKGAIVEQFNCFMIISTKQLNNSTVQQKITFHV